MWYVTVTCSQEGTHTYVQCDTVWPDPHMYVQCDTVWPTPGLPMTKRQKMPSVSEHPFHTLLYIVLLELLGNVCTHSFLKN